MRIGLALVLVLLSAWTSLQRTQTPAHDPVVHAADQTQSHAQTLEATAPAAHSAAPLPSSRSPIDFKHIIGADYKRHTGEPTGGHSLLRGDVRLVEGTESAPDASGVYRAQVQMADPQHPGQWITKTDRNGNPMPNTMFPKQWSAEQIVSEVEEAWFSPTKTIRGDKWSALTPSGVRVEGYLEPRVTAYPVYSKRH